MRTVSVVLLASSLLFVSPVMASGTHEHGAGGSHSHGPISSDAAVKKATTKVTSLIEGGKLDKSWANLKAVGATQKDFGKGPEWVVTFKNDTVSDATKQTLYLFYSLDGTYIATNFTGK